MQVALVLGPDGLVEVWCEGEPSGAWRLREAAS
jgi:hypothetical protein